MITLQSQWLCFPIQFRKYATFHIFRIIHVADFILNSYVFSVQSHSQQPMQNLQANQPAVNNPTTPLSMAILDALTVHAKMNLIHHIVQHMIKTAHSKNQIPLPPALVETYSRLLVYTEIEILGIKNFISEQRTIINLIQM